MSREALSPTAGTTSWKNNQILFRQNYSGSSRKWINDEAMRRVMNTVEMPDRMAENLVRFIRRNEGKLGRKRREGEFAKLTDDEVHSIEAIVREAFDGFTEAQTTRLRGVRGCTVRTVRDGGGLDLLALKKLKRQGSRCNRRPGGFTQSGFELFVVSPLLDYCAPGACGKTPVVPHHRPAVAKSLRKPEGKWEPRRVSMR